MIASADGSDVQVALPIVDQNPSSDELNQLAKKTINKTIHAAMTKQLQPALQILDKHRTTLDNEIKSNEEKIAKQRDVIKSAQNDADATNEKINTLNRKINTAHTACKYSLGWASFICGNQTSDLDSYFRYLSLVSGDKANQWKSAKRAKRKFEADAKLVLESGLSLVGKFEDKTRTIYCNTALFLNLN